MNERKLRAALERIRDHAREIQDLTRYLSTILPLMVDQGRRFRIAENLVAIHDILRSIPTLLRDRNPMMRQFATYQGCQMSMAGYLWHTSKRAMPALELDIEAELRRLDRTVS